MQVFFFQATATLSRKKCLEKGVHVGMIPLLNRSLGIVKWAPSYNPNKTCLAYVHVYGSLL